MRSTLRRNLLFLFALLATSGCLASKAEFELYRVYYGANEPFFRDLLANYSHLVRPVQNSSEPLRVRMRVYLQQIIGVIWTDYRLSWNPAKYNEITSVRFSSGSFIWQPDILLYNSADESFDSTYKSNLVVYNNGQINWIPPGIFRASCRIDITWFPFDDQSCYLKFGSWTYNGFAIDLQIDYEQGTGYFPLFSAALFQLKQRISLSFSAPFITFSSLTVFDTENLSLYWTANLNKCFSDTLAVREETFYVCCPEPYPTIKFYINLRRRTLFHGFNLIIPSLVIAVMTLITFSLPPHDMSEKIGFQTTVLLSVCFFLTIVSEMTPPTSDAVPLLGVFFSTLTLIVAISTTFTITVLNLRYRQSANCEMNETVRFFFYCNNFRCIFLNWLPWLLFMKRLRRKAGSQRMLNTTKDFASTECLQCAGVETIEREADSCMIELKRIGHLSIVRKLYSVPVEKLGLQRKVGEGIFTANRCIRARLRIAVLYEKYIRKCIDLLSDPQSGFYDKSTIVILKYYSMVYERLTYINERMKRNEQMHVLQEDWKYAAMVLDRFCFYIFSLFFIASIVAIFLSPPHLNA
ncbi:unnamed protein product [Toxocara canis]|uniref:Acetylcholine receptor subunit alpha-type acr-16 n=1 Tax=Toxocara canis TaxID=6265 RepID=A0A183TY28_TOXCA|nr:unnamed protein product [Toxocara canis]